MDVFQAASDYFRKNNLIINHSKSVLMHIETKAFKQLTVSETGF